MINSDTNTSELEPRANARMIKGLAALPVTVKSANRVGMVKIEAGF
jgi:hypothetical protein